MAPVLQFHAQVEMPGRENSRELITAPIADPFTFSGEMQTGEESPNEGAIAWNESFAFDVPDDLSSNFYAAKLEDSKGAQFFAPFVVQPSDDRRADIAVIVNVTTWNAYKWWGGYSRYSVPGRGAWVFAY
jgi:hypothetical protein